MYTLALTEDGDLDFSNRHGRVITGRDKLIQQLEIWLRENLNVDRFHPGYGSRLSSMIGSEHTQEVLDGIIDEVRRVVMSYINAVATDFDKNPQNYSKAEVPYQIMTIDGWFQGAYDVVVTFDVRTMDNESFTVTTEV